MNETAIQTSFKVDIFLLQDTRFDRLRFEHRSLEPFGEGSGSRAYITSAEDLILARLVWYRLGNEISDRQWRDIVDVITVTGASLDTDYLRDLAIELGVSDLLERAFAAHPQ